jgi:hypothetical protein
VVWVDETSRPFASLAPFDWYTCATQASHQLAIDLAIFLWFELQKIENSSPIHL